MMTARQSACQLACQGGKQVRVDPLPPWPHFDKDEIDAVATVLAAGKVNYWTGDEGRRFEEEYASALGVAHAIALANGTVALELGLRAFGIGPGDDVIVPAKTFIATASAVVAVGARPVVVDVDPITQNLSVESVRAGMTAATKAIIVVHLGGWPADMPALMQFAAEQGLVVVEDCAQAHGAAIDGRFVGSFGDCAAFSFCQDKIITTGGEGGLLVFRDDDAAWKRAWAFKDHGKDLDEVSSRSHPPGFRWLHHSFGTNMRMTEMQAAIGRRQLSKLEQWHSRRAENANTLHAKLKGVPGLVLVEPEGRLRHAWYRYYAFLDLDKLARGWDQVRIVQAINAEGIPCFVGSCSEIYREKAFSAHGFVPRQPLRNAARLGTTSLAFLVHPTLGAKDMWDTAAAIDKVMAFATKGMV